MFRPAGHNYIVPGIPEAVLNAQFFCNGIPQAIGSGNGGIFGDTSIEGILCGIFDMGGSVEIRLSRTKADHIYPFRFHSFCLRGNRQCWRRFNVGKPICEFHQFRSFLNKVFNAAEWSSSPVNSFQFALNTWVDEVFYLSSETDDLLYDV